MSACGAGRSHCADDFCCADFPMNRQRGLCRSTPESLNRLPKETIADKELSALLAGNRLVPIVHGTTHAALREVSPLLASRTGLDTAEEPMTDVAGKIAELVTL
jgi:hypothetical protein